MTTAVVWGGLVATAVCLVVGVWSAVQTMPKRREVLAAVKAPKAPAAGELPGPVTDQSVSSTVDAVAKLASALKDLDHLAQLFTLALGFLAVAAVAAGVDAFAQAVK